MSITVDSVAQAVGSASPLTYSHTVAAGAVLYVGVMSGFDSSQTDITSVTFNGDALSQVGSYEAITDSGLRLSMWKIDNPDSGTHDVVITYTDAVPMLTGSSISLLGADTSGSSGATDGTAVNGSTQIDLGQAITTTEPNSVNVSLSVNNQGAQTQSATGTNQTLQQQINNTLVGRYGNARTGISTQTTTTAGSYTSSFSTTGGGKNLGIIVVEVKEAVAAGPANVKTWDGVTQATGIKTYFGVGLANVKTVNGVN